jgi:ABC-2 type transport system permease protein
VRALSLFHKTWIENIRDWKILILTLTFAPLFVLLMYFYAGETAQSPHRVVIVNDDLGVSTVGGAQFNAGEALILEMARAHDADGKKLFEVHEELELSQARDRLANHAADLVVLIPANFSQTLLAYMEGEQPPAATVRTYGDPANAKYIMAAVWSDVMTYDYAAEMTGVRFPVAVEANSISGIKSLNEFELYVPALLALAVIMLMFTAAASLIKEKDKGTVIRLRLSNMKTVEWLTAVSLTQVIIGMLALLLTYWTAVALGYKSTGSLLAMMAVGLLACLSIIGISLIVAAYLRTIFDLLTIGCFPFFILMFFSGGMFPLPPVRLFTMGERVININDVLPTTHAIAALGKILNQGAGLGDVVFELIAIAVLTVVFFVMGVWLFARRQMRTAVG